MPVSELELEALRDPQAGLGPACRRHRRIMARELGAAESIKPGPPLFLTGGEVEGVIAEALCTERVDANMSAARLIFVAL